jgi:Flp pilus assembly protein protease CpaA
MLDVALITVTFIVLLVSSYTDLKTREVPDMISYGLIFAGLGLRVIYSFDLGWPVLVSGLLGFVVCFGVSLLFYYAGQWGGGDSKLLMGMGAVIGITYPFEAGSFMLLWYFMALLFLGAIYGVFWMAWLAFKNKKEFVITFKKKLEKLKIVHYVSLGLSVALLLVSIFYPMWSVFVVVPLGLFYLLNFVSSVEEKCFIKRISPLRLTEGDWLSKDVYVGKKLVVKKKTLNIDDINKLLKFYDKSTLSKVAIKEGIPFIPSFLFAYVFIVFGSLYFNRILGLFL